MTPADIWNHLKDVFKQAKKLREAFESEVPDVPTFRVPFVTVSAPHSLYLLTLLTGVELLQVFLDEVNTSSCLGLFKEIIVDRTFDGVVSDSPYKDTTEAMT